MSLGAAIIFAPRAGKSQKDSTKTEALNSTGEAEFNEQLESVKKAMDAPALAGIEFFESRLNQSTGMAKTTWLDSLTSAWDRQMRP